MKKLLLFISIAFIFGLEVHAQNGLKFDGIDDSVSTTYSGIAGSAPRTIECWINTSSSTAAQRIISDYGYFGTSTLDNGKRFTLCLNNAHLARVEIRGWGLNGVTPLNDGLWHHLAVSYDGNTMNLYVDGTLEGSAVPPISVNTTLITNLLLGVRTDGANHWDATLDEFRFWSIARSQSEIIADMNSEYCTSQPGLEVYYKLNEGSTAGSNPGVTTAYDAVGGYHGTLNTFTLSGTTSNWVAGSGITINQIYHISNSYTECQGFSLTVNGNTYNSAGIYSDTMTSVSGCDSIVESNITIVQPTTGVDTHISCGNFIWIDGNTYSTSNNTATYTIVGGSSAGCDSTVTLNLTVNQPSFGTDVQTACGSYTWIDGNTYTSSNNTASHTILGGSSNGCDSIVSLDLTILTVDVTTTVNGIEIIANNGNGTYQWINCSNNSPITGATNQTFTPTTNGAYAVVVTDGNCSDTSSCVTINSIGLSENILLGKIYPNPVYDLLQIELEGAGSVTIINAVGQIIHNGEFTDKVEVNCQNFPSGVYTVELSNSKNIARYFIVKR